MKLEKKQIAKEDGRYLVYYHFSKTATEEQTAVFDSVIAEPPPTKSQIDEKRPGVIIAKFEA